MLGQGDTIKDFQNRFPIFFYIIVGFFAVLTLRLFYLQLYKGGFYRRFSEEISLRKEKLPGPRGQIFDRENKLLVDNRLQLDITLTPQFSKNPRQLIDKVADLAGEPADRIFERYKEKVFGNPRFQPVTLIENAPWPLVVKIESLKAELGGVEVEPRIRRTYLRKQVGAHLFGYLSEITKRELKNANIAAEYELGDWLGRSGLERKWENYLRGKDGVRYVVVNAHGHRIQHSAETTAVNVISKDVPPEPGHNLVLTLDDDLQTSAAEAMKGKMGAVVALDPRTGEILAMQSMPGFDPTEMANKGPELWRSFMKSPYGPMSNKTIQDHYPPGSTFKIFTALAALEEKVVTPQTTFNCPGFLKFGKRIFNCHIQRGHGLMNLENALRSSCDVYFYNLATRLSVDAISKIANMFGLGKRTGVALYNEVPGLMPTEEWKLKTFKEAWQGGETLSVSIGQGYDLVTPLQLALAYATFVNGGNLYRPYVVSRIEDVNGKAVKTFGPELLSNHKINPEYQAIIQEGLSKVINDPQGTAYHMARSTELKISGKSGTAQVISLSRDELFKPCANLPFEKRHLAWFVGYAPQKDPEIVVAVLGLHECGGGRSSGPVVKAMIEKWWQKKKAREAMRGPQPASVL